MVYIGLKSMDLAQSVKFLLIQRCERQRAEGFKNDWIYGRKRNFRQCLLGGKEVYPFVKSFPDLFHYPGVEFQMSRDVDCSE